MDISGGIFMMVVMVRFGVVALSLVLGWLSIGCGTSGSALPPPLPPMPAPTDSSSAAETPDADESVLFGHYRHVGGQPDADARDAAIDAALAEMPVMMAARAGSRLRERNAIAQELTLSETPDGVSVDFEGKVQLDGPLGGTPVEVTTPEGREMQLSYLMRGPTLVQTMQGSRGGMRRIYTPQADGKLLVHVTVFASMLEKAIEYDLHYAKPSPNNATDTPAPKDNTDTPAPKAPGPESPSP